MNRARRKARHRGSKTPASAGKSVFDQLNLRIIQCEQCPRLRDWCEEVAVTKRAAYRDQDYWGRPVPNFGDPQARVLIVGLAPGAHGANRTGRMFTGDRSGDWLFRALHRAGFAKQVESTSVNDGQCLVDCAITSACHCAPPDNKPERSEFESCAPWLDETFQLLPVTVLVALGAHAWDACWKLHLRMSGALTGHSVAGSQKQRAPSRPLFGHGREHRLSGELTLIGSYHPSQQNTLTGRLTEPMLDSVFQRARELISKVRKGLPSRSE